MHAGGWDLCELVVENLGDLTKIRRSWQTRLAGGLKRKLPLR